MEKRQFSNQSENGSDSKKQCQEHIIVDDVFKESLQSPDWFDILLMCLSNLENQINSIFEEPAESKESRMEGAKQLQEMIELPSLVKNSITLRKKGNKKIRLSKVCKTTRSIWKNELKN